MLVGRNGSGHAGWCEKGRDILMQLDNLEVRDI